MDANRRNGFFGKTKTTFGFRLVMIIEWVFIVGIIWIIKSIFDVEISGQQAQFFVYFSGAGIGAIALHMILGRKILTYMDKWGDSDPNPKQSLRNGLTYGFTAALVLAIMLLLFFFWAIR
jgi:hypothetical protein